VQSTGGPDVTIRHNNISGASNAAVQTGGSVVNMTIENNLLSGGGWTLNLSGTVTNIHIINNRFVDDAAYGPWAVNDPAAIITGNAYVDGSPIP
ncbi:MAG: hypothetical protein V1879_04890, partial [Pseudomonadota bacterium]